jgi:hypothetical protein
MSFADRFVAEIISIQVKLYSARARLESHTDIEALAMYLWGKWYKAM